MNVISQVIMPILIGILFTLLVPVASNKLIDYKNKKASVEREMFKTSKLFEFLFPLTVGIAAVYFVNWRNLAFWQQLFVIIFCFIGCVGTLVDNRIRIIPNELVLFILFLAIPYRLIDGGFSYLLNSFVTMFGIMSFLVGTFFILRMFIASIVPAGAGDLKLVMAVAFVLGYPDIINGMFFISIFLCGYVFVGMFFNRLTFKSYVPMAGFIMSGMMFELLVGGNNVWELLKIFY